MEVFLVNFFKSDLLPALQTRRLLLREMRPSDSADMYEYSRLPEVTRYLLWDEHPNSHLTKRYLEQVRRQYRGGDYYDWAIIYQGSDDDTAPLRALRGRMIGTCGFASIRTDDRCGELGYVLSPDAWGYGIAAEAGEAVMRFGFEVLDLFRIEARYIVGNDQSRRVMEKLGMSFEGIHRAYMMIKGGLRDIGICAVLRPEFFSRFGS